MSAPVSLRAQIGEHLASVAASSRLNKGGAKYGQPFYPDRLELPFDHVTPGADFYGEEYNRRIEVTTDYIVHRFYRFGFEEGDFYTIGDEHIYDLIHNFVVDEQNRHNDANRDLDFNVTLGAAAPQFIPDEETLAAVNLKLTVTYSLNGLNPYSQDVD